MADVIGPAMSNSLVGSKADMTGHEYHHLINGNNTDEIRFAGSLGMDNVGGNMVAFRSLGSSLPQDSNQHPLSSGNLSSGMSFTS